MQDVFNFFYAECKNPLLSVETNLFFKTHFSKISLAFLKQLENINNRV